MPTEFKNVYLTEALESIQAEKRVSIQEMDNHTEVLEGALRTKTDNLKEELEASVSLAMKVPILKDVNAMKVADGLLDGDVVQLQGYNSAGDGLHHMRKLSTIDDGTGMLLSSGLYANYVKDSKIADKLDKATHDEEMNTKLNKAGDTYLGDILPEISTGTETPQTLASNFRMVISRKYNEGSDFGPYLTMSRRGISAGSIPNNTVLGGVTYRIGESELNGDVVIYNTQAKYNSTLNSSVNEFFIRNSSGSILRTFKIDKNGLYDNGIKTMLESDVSYLSATDPATHFSSLSTSDGTAIITKVTGVSKIGKVVIMGLQLKLPAGKRYFEAKLGTLKSEYYGLIQGTSGMFHTPVGANKDGTYIPQAGIVYCTGNTRDLFFSLANTDTVATSYYCQIMFVER